MNNKTQEKSSQKLFTKSKSNGLSREEISKIDHKDPKKLKKILTARGRIMSRRLTNMTAKEQRKARKHALQSRYLALTPYVSLEG